MILGHVVPQYVRYFAGACFIGMSTTLSSVTDKRTTQGVDPHIYVVIENHF